MTWAITIVSQSDTSMFMSRALSNAHWELGSAKWAVSIFRSSITNGPIEMSLRNCLAANIKELAMHSSLMSRVASIDADSFVHFAKEIPQRAANLYVDEAYSPANMAQLVLALAKHSQGGLWLESEPTLLDACHQMINSVQGNIFGRVGASTLPMAVYGV